ncbi:hypothetical protein IJ076_00665 [Candidatus Saccharibacteria bacterium]|nr:hypothetical protein [Candidatus Saccharibacteria bacterium]
MKEIFSEKTGSIVFIILALFFANFSFLPEPVYAEENLNPISSETDDTKISTTPEQEPGQKPEEAEQPSEKPGEHWDGSIEEPDNTTINEPSIPDEPIVEIVEVKTYTATPVAPVAPASTTNTERQETVSEDTENPEKTPEALETSETLETPETPEAPEEPEIELPKTSTVKKDNSRKIHLMAIVATGITVFSSIGITSGIELVKLTRKEKKLAKDSNPLKD